MKPLATEKAITMLESKNVVTFEVDNKLSKEEIKKKVEDLLEVKVESVRTLVRGTRKIAYVKLKKSFLAMDLATKLGML